MRSFAPAVTLSPGDRIGPYEIEALLGAGGMGEVYRGRDPRLGRAVALKVIAPRLADDLSFRRRFELEARAASVLNHPSIVTIYDVGESGGLPWIAMEWVEGRTLRQALDGGPLPLADVWSIARQVAEGLAAAHAKGIVHRDLKPENVVLGLDGRARVLDFGLARISVGDVIEGVPSMAPTMAPLPGATFAGSILGTVGYMSPEQSTGRPIDFRSDQFALGLLLYEMLTGRQAFRRPTPVETLAAIVRDEPPPVATLRSDVPDALERVVARCLAKAPRQRFDSTRQLVAALAADMATVPAAVPDVRPAAGARKSSLLSRALVIAATAVLGIAATIGWNRTHSPAPRAIDSLAVLPFDSTTGDADTEYLGDGLTDTLIGRMSGVPSLRVMARGTVARFRGTDDPRTAARQLGVGAVVAGRVSRRGDRLSVSAELIDSATGQRLWGRTFDGPFADVLQVQDSIAASIAEGLKLRLSDDERRALLVHGTDNPDAFELFLRGRYLLAHDTEEDDIAARELFRQALEKDPRFVQARLDLAATYVRSAGNLYASPTDAWARADEALKPVLEVDPHNFGARVSLAVRHFMYEWDWVTARREFDALENDPRLLASNAYHPVAIFNWVSGRTDRAVTVMERALRVDPANVESKVMLADLLVQAGRLDDAVAQYKAIAAAAPGDSRPFYGLADVMKTRGDLGAALQALRTAYELSDEPVGVDALARARTEADYEAAEVLVARARLSYLLDEARNRYVSPLDIARLHAQVGDRDRAFAALALAVGERSPGLVHLKVDRAWDRIRDDQRFVAVVRQVRIP